MKKMNQYEASIKTLQEQIPVFVRKAYEAYLNIEDDWLGRIDILKISRPGTAKKHIDAYVRGKNNGNILSAHRSIVNQTDAINTVSYLNTLECKVSCDFINDIDDFDIESPDLFAPINLVRGAVINLSNGLDIIAKAGTQYTPAIVVQPYARNFEINPINIHENSMGFVSIFDNLLSECVIDISDLFKIFHDMVGDEQVFTPECATESAVAEAMISEDENKADALYEDIVYLKKEHERIRCPKFSNTVIDIVSKAVLKSAIATYLVFVGKTVGIKSDLFGWMYNFFVKDSLKDVERGDFPTSSDITQMAGMQNNSDANYSEFSCYEQDAIDPTNNAVNQKKFNANVVKMKMWNGTDAVFNPSIFYRNIRLLYSNWASVINAIIRIGHAYPGYKPSYQEEDFNKKSVAFKPSVDMTKINHIDLAKQVLIVYTKCRFRTYNTPYQTCLNKDQSTVSTNDFIKVGLGRITDIVLKETVKEQCLKDTKSAYFVDYTNSSIATLNAQRAECDQLADTFMSIAYIMLLDYIHTHQEEVLSTNDPYTGKPKRELFEEIYYNLDNAIKTRLSLINPRSYCIFNYNKHELITDLNNFTNKTSASPLHSKNIPVTDSNEPLDSLHVESCNSEFVNGVLKTFGVDNNNSKNPMYYAIGSGYIYPPISDYVEFNYCDVTEYRNGMSDNFQTRANSLFPKNQVIIEDLTKIRLRTDGIIDSAESTVTSVDFSLEKLEEAISHIENSFESEWAHMSHNDLAAIGGAVTDLEITNDSDATVTTSLDKNEDNSSIKDAPVSKVEIQVVNTDGEPDDVDITTGVIAAQKPSDSDDVKELTSSTERAKLLVNRYNALFNKLVR